MYVPVAYTDCCRGPTIELESALIKAAEPALLRQCHVIQGCGMFGLAGSWQFLRRIAKESDSVRLEGIANG